LPDRIAVVIDPWAYPYNGTVVSTRRFVPALEAAGFDFRLLAIEGPWEVEQQDGVGFPKLSIPGVNGIIDRMRAPLARPVRERLRQALSGCRLLHVQYPFFLGHAAIGEARRLRIPVVCSFHVQPENILDNLGLSSPLLSRGLYRLFLTRFYNRADRVIAPSAFAAALLRSHGLTSPLTVISNGVPDVFFQQKALPHGGRFRVLAVGRLAREKQHETLLRAVAASRHRGRIELTIGGVGPRETALRSLAARLGVPARIGWLGPQELLDAYAAADLVVHAGTAELEGMSVLEAMAAGNTVLVADCADSACAHFVTDPRVRFASGDVRDLAGKIDRWLADDGAREAKGEDNRRFAATLSHDRSTARLANVYRELLAPTGASETPKPCRVP
jgi:glycosyltransferase involved in cell wall biosynthesis